MEIAYAEALQAFEHNPVPWRTVLPPNRLESSYWDFLAALAQAQPPQALDGLRAALRRLTGRQQVFFAPSCRCAIAQVLSLLPHKEVVMPAYTCPVVKTAVQVAGKRIIYVDVARQGVNATAAEFAEHAAPGRVLLPTHLFGIPTDIEAICQLARERDCVTVEDAAAALGARHHGRLLGTFADVGIFSFERSKRLPAFRGAAIVLNNEKLIEPARFRAMPGLKIEQAMPLKELAFALAYKAATVPWIYGRFTLPRLLRQYKLQAGTEALEDEQTAIHTPFYTQAFHPFQAALVARMLERLDQVRHRVAPLVNTYLHTLRDSPVATFVPPQFDAAGLLRFPVACAGKKRAEILRRALQRGIYLEVNYEQPLPEEAERPHFPNAVWAADNVLLLPLYAALRPAAAQWLAQQLLEIEREAISPAVCSTAIPVAG